MATKTEVLSWFRGQLGYREGKNNANKYAKIAGHANNQPWCATFLVAGFRSCKMTLGNESAYIPSLMGSLGPEIDGPAPGAIGVLYFEGLGRYAHGVIVESVREDGRFVTFEGNTNVAGSREGKLVMRKVRSTNGFKFFMPEYTPESKPTSPAKPYYGNCVKLQRAVHVEADNIWGPDTDKACDAIRNAGQKKFPFGVKFVQGIVGVEQTGAWGGESRRALQRVVMEAQAALIEMSHVKFPRTGVWDTPTESAYQKVRKICRRP